MSGGSEASESRRGSRETPGSARARSIDRGVLGIQQLANGLGPSVILLYVSLLFPSEADAPSELNLQVFGVYLAINLVLGLPINLLLLRRAVAWVRNGTEATARQRWL